ncbi:hypothetical protein ACSBR2_038024 [Camellia fascicularis]
MVVLTARDEQKGALKLLKISKFMGINGVIVDAEAFASLNLKDGEVMGAKAHLAKKAMKETYETVEGCLRTNYYGPKQLTQALLPLLQLSNSTRIVNVSSTLGQLKVVGELGKGLGHNGRGLGLMVGVEEIPTIVARGGNLPKPIGAARGPRPEYPLGLGAGPGLGPNFLTRESARPEFWQEPGLPNMGQAQFTPLV